MLVKLAQVKKKSSLLVAAVVKIVVKKIAWKYIAERFEIPLA